jgi:FAD synthase
MVMNVGKRPTVNIGDEAPTVEVHVMHNYPQDFYGEVRGLWRGMWFMERYVSMEKYVVWEEVCG